MSENIKVTFDTAEEDLHVNLDAGAIMYGKMQIGTTTTGESGTEAKVENVGSQTNAILNFTIPKGDKGEQGEKGEKGDTGSPVEVKDIPANTNIDEFHEEGTYAWNGDDGKAITGLPGNFSGFDVPQSEYVLKVTKLSSRTTETQNIDSYMYEFSFSGALLYTQVRTVYTNIETGSKSYMNRSWHKVAMSNANGLIVYNTEPNVDVEKAAVWIQRSNNMFNIEEFVNDTQNLGFYTRNGNNLIINATDGRTSGFTYYVKVEKNKTYTLSTESNVGFRVYDYGNSTPIVNVNGAKTATFTPTTNLIAVKFVTGNTLPYTVSNVMLNVGTEKITFEPYADKKIYTKNDNGVYEEFINADDLILNQFKINDKNNITDFNSFTKNGFYMINVQKCSNAPNQYATGMLLVFGSYYISQLYIADLNGTTVGYIRMSSDKGATWNSWSQITTDVATTSLDAE